ncbi:MAG: hypothetical protein AAFO06_19180 [Cyanobacteria bacterium J06597_16]
MSIDSKASGKVRLTLDLSSRLNDELERLAEDSGRTKAELMRLGLDFLSKAARARDQGMTVGAWTEDERGIRREREFIGM